MNQMQDIAVAIVEENQAIALVVERFAEELDAFTLQLRVRGVEIVDRDGEMADAGVLEIRRRLPRQGGFGGNELEHGAVGRAHEKIPVVGEIDVESEIIDVPLGELFRVRRRDGGVLQTLKHKPRL